MKLFEDVGLLKDLWAAAAARLNRGELAGVETEIRAIKTRMDDVEAQIPRYINWLLYVWNVLVYLEHWGELRGDKTTIGSMFGKGEFRVDPLNNEKFSATMNWQDTIGPRFPAGRFPRAFAFEPETT